MTVSLDTCSPNTAEAVQTAVAHSFSAWHDLISESFVPLHVRSSDPTHFHGRLRSRLLDELSIVEVTATGHSVHRTPSLISRSDRLYFKLNLQLEGSGILVQDNREAVLLPGDLAVYDTHRPYTLAFESDFRTLVLMFPHDALDLPAGSVGGLTATRMAADQGLGRMISPFMTQLAENLEVLSGPSGHRLAHNAVDLLGTLFAAELDHRQDGTGHPHEELLGRIRRFIEVNLADPGLSPASVAAAHFISTRHLHNVFQEAGTTVAQWIRTRRLENCRRELRDPLQAHRAVSAIAARWGFLEAAHFSRIFRAAFGEPPSSYRRAAAQA
ncbi:helix-turn-helix domain-containing protein [Paenarthrobacter sp. PH39-S1]|uniref:AraC-like ligand-binding domain-containing protein n=1 Tax=Paenarthrobacter sp. PH39-S1 TaxID=3046204 RepID=UPI0024B9471F|nr:helix-turn-helix domain-containing protein [Paenarthrobacter sp. PH39-S1]MDJ0357805.1 helix-turn-helix domain-containing protein [Paenarthrobacter sp. PH39-S1]